jgi:hypothetical protein
MKTALLTAGILAWMFTYAGAQGVVGQPTVSSNPGFFKEGPNAYVCTSPKGRKLHCNRWVMISGTGWKRTCVQPGQPLFGDRLDAYDLPVQIDHPETGCVALFDEAWSDFRRWEARNQDRELARTLRPAEFHQFVEIAEPGLYEMNACMTRNVHVPIGDEDNSINVGGINVTLLQFHQEVGRLATVHLILPNKKAMFGPDRAQPLNGAKNFDQMIASYDNWPPEQPADNTVIGILDDQQAHVQGGELYNPHGMRPDYYIDGYDGHAGLKDSYGTGGDYSFGGDPTIPPTMAQWTCYKDTVFLDIGFYKISAEIHPTFYRTATDHQGFGAIKHISLRKAQ